MRDQERSNVKWFHQGNAGSHDLKVSRILPDTSEALSSFSFVKARSSYFNSTHLAVDKEGCRAASLDFTFTHSFKVRETFTIYIQQI